MNFVFTVCERAGNEDCPAWQGQPVSAHWGMPDPVKTEGTNARKSLAIQQAYEMVKAYHRFHGASHRHARQAIVAERRG